MARIINDTTFLFMVLRAKGYSTWHTKSWSDISCSDIVMQNMS